MSGLAPATDWMMVAFFDFFFLPGGLVVALCSPDLAMLAEMQEVTTRRSTTASNV